MPDFGPGPLGGRLNMNMLPYQDRKIPTIKIDECRTTESSL